MRQPIEPVQSESTSTQAVYRLPHHQNLPWCQDTLRPWEQKLAGEQRRHEGMEINRELGADALILWYTQHDPINNQIPCSGYSLEKATFLAAPNSEECRQGCMLSTTPQGHLWAIYVFKQKNPKTNSYPSHKKSEGKISKCFDCKRY